MKTMGRLFLVVAALVALLAAFYCLRPKKVAHIIRDDARPPTSDLQHADKASGSPELSATAQHQLAVTNSPMVEFSSWTEKYLTAATDAEKQALVGEGEELAKARLAEMYELIKTDPKQALASAVPYEQRKRLPESILALLEKPV